jgi:hypothetical protein
VASRRELLEAQAFERHRLVRAFVSGRVELAESERMAAGRALAIGLVLAVIVGAVLVTV